MNSYQPSTPRAAFGLAAVAMAAISIGAMVVLPATLDSADVLPIASAKAGAPAPIEVAISPARIDVIVVRTPDVAWALAGDGKPNCKPES
jgi:hypothetical protein